MNTQSKHTNIDIAIIGAGLAGLSTAYHLAERTDYKIRIFDKEPEAGLGASTKNASMICRLSPDPILSQIMSSSIYGLKLDWLRRFKSTLSFNECGSWHIGSDVDIQTFQESVEQLKSQGVDIATYSKAKAIQLEPELSQASFDQAIWCPSDGVIQTNQLIKTLVDHLKQKGVSFRFMSPVATEPFNDEDMALLHNGHKYRARFIINAAGAWGSKIDRSSTLSHPSYTLLKRHLFITRPLPVEYQRKRPIIWDISNPFYMRPEEQSVLMSACDNVPSSEDLCTIDSTAYDAIENKLNQFGVAWKDIKFMRLWSGLRTFSPDGRFIIGQDPQFKQLYWLTCLGGYGLTASYQVGKMLADQILGFPTDQKLQEAVSPARFINKTSKNTSADYR